MPSLARIGQLPAELQLIFGLEMSKVNPIDCLQLISGTELGHFRLADRDQTRQVNSSDHLWCIGTIGNCLSGV